VRGDSDETPPIDLLLLIALLAVELVNKSRFSNTMIQYDAIVY